MYGYREYREPPKFIRILKNRKLTILVGALLLAVLMITFSNKGLLRRIMLENELKDKQQRIQTLKNDIRLLETDRDKLHRDNLTIEHVAREKHGMVKPGEIVYRIVPAKGNTRK